MLVLGIDENGLAPLLGPFVATGTLFRVPDDNPEIDLWDAFSDTVSRNPSDFPGKLVVNDSKLVFRPPNPKGLKILGAAAAAFSFPPYSALEAEFIAQQSLVLCPREFNQQLLKYGVKSLLNLGCFVDLINHFLKHHPRDDFKILCGKIGSVKKYTPPLKQLLFLREGGQLPKRGLFEPGEAPAGSAAKKLRRPAIKSIKESPAISQYLFADQNRLVDLSFIKNGEDAHLPIALSSMIGKYLRELQMRRLNEFFQSFDATLPYASGYPNQKTYEFIRRSKPLRQKLKIPDLAFIRQR